MASRLSLALLVLWFAPKALGFSPLATPRRCQLSPVCRQVGSASASAISATEDATDIDFLFEEEERERAAKKRAAYEKLDSEEKVWRYAKKPLLRIGSKGATHSHGNSLRQLLDDHTVVKVKVNTKKFGTLEKASEALQELAVENGAPKDMELIQMRQTEKTIMFGMPGTMERVKEGTFPPPPPEPETTDEEPQSKA